MSTHRTKKVGVAGKFGTRIGRRLREEIKKIHESKKESKCPECSSKRVKRISLGIWKCTKCGLDFTGEAYSIKVKEVVKGKEFGSGDRKSSVKKEEAK
jgi:large subunit ribosomal protein L37Ae